VTFAEGAGPDPRCYRVGCAKLATTLPGLRLRWTVRRGVEQLYQAFKEHGLQLDDLTGSRFQRLARIKSLMERPARRRPPLARDKGPAKGI
jgi:hypothetical protein